ncbi:MAG: Error-prone repair protein ImuA [Chryseolinea sp.]
MALARAEKVAQLQQEIHRMEGFRPAPNPAMNTVLGPLAAAFPSGAFPLGVLHEFLLGQERNKGSMAASVGFIAAMVSSILSGSGVMMWISAERRVFPPSLIGFGVRPDQVIFVDIRKARNVLWATEEALKCSAVAVVAAEVGRLDLTVSRRLQLSAEQSQATGFLIRNDLHPGITSSASRWRITPSASVPIGSLPGIGHPQWKVELLKLRGGHTGNWNIRYRQGRFEEVQAESFVKISAPLVSKVG